MNSTILDPIFHKIVKYEVYVWLAYFLLTYFTIQLIFCTIHESHYTILTNIYLYLQYFQQNVFSFNKISGFQTNPKDT